MICEGGGTDGTQPQRPANTPTCDKTPPRVTNPSPPGGPPPAAPKQRKLGLHVPPPTSPHPAPNSPGNFPAAPGERNADGSRGAAAPHRSEGGCQRRARPRAARAAGRSGASVQAALLSAGAARGPPPSSPLSANLRPSRLSRSPRPARARPRSADRRAPPPPLPGSPPASPAGRAAPAAPERSAGAEGGGMRCGAGRRGAGRPSRRLPAPLPSPRAPGLRRSPVPARRPLPLALPPSRSSPCQRQHGRDRGRAPPRRILPAARGDGARAGPGPSGRRFGPAPTEAAKPKWRRLLLHRERAPGAPPPRARPRPLRRPHPLTVAPPPSRQPEGRGGRREKRPELSGWVGPRSRCAFCPFPAAVAPRSARSRGDPVSAARCGGCRR